MLQIFPSEDQPTAFPSTQQLYFRIDPFLSEKESPGDHARRVMRSSPIRTSSLPSPTSSHTMFRSLTAIRV